MQSNVGIRHFKDSMTLPKALPLLVSLVFFVVASVSLWLYFSAKAGAFGIANGVALNNGRTSTEMILLLPAIGLITLGVFIIVLIYRSIGKRSFDLYEDKVVSKFKKNPETEIYFSEIKEVYRFRALPTNKKDQANCLDSLAYRRTAKDHWVVVTPKVKAASKKYKDVPLIKEITRNYIRAGLPQIFEDLNQGRSISFDYLLDTKNQLREPFDKIISRLATQPLNDCPQQEVAKTYNNIKTIQIILTKDGISLNNSKAFFRAGDKVTLTGYNLKIINSDNETIFAIDTTYLINSDLFIITIAKLLDSN